MRYQCIKCKKSAVKFKTDQRKSRKEFWYVDENGKKLRGNTCHCCSLRIQKARRANEKNSTTRRYEKTPDGFLMRLYRNMKSRITGVQKQKAHLYLNKELISKDEFYAWAKSKPDFFILFSAYEESGFDRKLAPTVDRIDAQVGYEISNMRWLTHSENSRLGAASKWNKARSVLVDPSKAQSPSG